MLRARFAATPARVKIVAAAVAGSIVVAVSIAFGATRDTRVALFAAPLKADQLREVDERLAAWRIPYAPGADNVRVDRAKRSEILLKLAVAGVPRAHLATSDEMFARAGALTPQAVLEAQTRDGLAADLALGLRGLDGVADARVIIAPARSGMYADETSHDASASVRITLAAGTQLNARTIEGIRAFVAGGVPGLDAERVTILDDRGLALDGDRDGDAAQAALQSALDAAFGAGGAIVRVHRERSAEKRDVRDVRRTPLPGAIARTSTDERYASEKKRYSKNGSVEDRGSDTREEHRVTLPGATGRLSIAIFVDAARGLDLAKLRSLAEATAGLDRDRGDLLSVEAVPFAARASGPASVATPWAVLGAFSGIVPQLVVALAIAFGIVAGAKPAYALMMRALETAQVRVRAGEVAGIPPARVRGALAGEPPHIAAAIISALPAATAAAVLELYPAAERAAIVRRLARATAGAPLVPHPEELVHVRG